MSNSNSKKRKYVFSYEQPQKRKKIKIIKRSNKQLEALKLPTVLNCNPQSIYNKKDELSTFIKEKNIQISYISESWQRENYALSDLLSELKPEDYTIISNLYQRKGKGGRPIIIIKNDKYYIEDLTQSVVSVPWGCEVVWMQIV